MTSRVPSGKKDESHSDDDGVIVENLAEKQKKQQQLAEKEAEKVKLAEMVEAEKSKVADEKVEKVEETPKKEPDAAPAAKKFPMSPKKVRSERRIAPLLCLGASLALLAAVLSLPSSTETVNCFMDYTNNVPAPEPLRVVPCVSAGGRIIPRLKRTDQTEVAKLLLESPHNLLEGLPENGLSSLAMEILSNSSIPSMYIDFRQFTHFDTLIAESFGVDIQGHLYDGFKAVEKVLKMRVNDGKPPMLMVFDHFEVALRNSQFEAERFYTWVFDMEHKALLRAKFLSSDVKLATTMRELVKWKLSPVAFPAVSKSDVRAYLANVTVLDAKSIERVALHGTNLGIISRIAAQYLRGHEKAANSSLDDCLRRLTPRSDFLAHLGHFAWTQ